MAQPNTGVIRSRQTYTDDSKYSSTNNNRKTPSDEYYNKTNQMIKDYRSSLNNGGSGGGYAEVAVDPYASLRSAWGSWLDDQLGYYKGLYENAMGEIEQRFKSARDQANVKRKMGENWIKSNSPYDEGRFYKLGNQNQQNWINATMNARNERTRASNQALADLNNQNANARSVYAQKIASLM